MSLTKADLTDSIHRNLDISRARSSELLGSLLETIKRTLESGENILISGFGKFYVKNKNERRGRNPATGNDLILDSRKVVTFSSSPLLKDKINGKTQKPTPVL